MVVVCVYGLCVLWSGVCIWSLCLECVYVWKEREKGRIVA